MYRDEYDALDEQLQAARREADAQRRRMGEELESERRKVRDLERKLAQAKRTRESTPEVPQVRRKVLVMAALLGLAVALGAGYMFVQISAPPPPPPPKPVVAKPPRPPRKPLPPPLGPPVLAPGSKAYLLSLVDRARTPSRQALALVATAAVHKRSGQDKQAAAALGKAEALLGQKMKMHTDSMLRATGLVECLGQAITGKGPGAGGRYVKLEPLLEKQLSYKIAADTWTWVGQVCLDLGGGPAALEALPRALAVSTRVQSYQRLRTIMAVAAIYEEQRDLEGVDRVASRVLDSKTKLIVTDLTKGQAMLAEIYWRLGRKERGIALLKEAALQRPGKYFSAEAHAMVARALAVVGQRAAAEARLAVATEAVKANNPWSRKKAIPHLAATHLLLGRAREGKELLEGMSLAAESMIEAGMLIEAATVKQMTYGTRYRLALALTRAGEQTLAVKVADALGYNDTKPLALAAVMINGKAEVGEGLVPSR